MKVYTYSEARQAFAAVLAQAQKDGAVRINRRDGQSFLITPARPGHSPLDIKGVPLKLSAKEIVHVVREGRRRGDW